MWSRYRNWLASGFRTRPGGEERTAFAGNARAEHSDARAGCMSLEGVTFGPLSGLGPPTRCSGDVVARSNGATRESAGAVACPTRR